MPQYRVLRGFPPLGKDAWLRIVGPAIVGANDVQFVITEAEITKADSAAGGEVELIIHPLATSMPIGDAMQYPFFTFDGRVFEVSEKKPVRLKNSDAYSVKVREDIGSSSGFVDPGTSRMP